MQHQSSERQEPIYYAAMDTLRAAGHSCELEITEYEMAASCYARWRKVIHVFTVDGAHKLNATRDTRTDQEVVDWLLSFMSSEDGESGDGIPQG